jgi:hypothetical protein
VNLFWILWILTSAVVMVAAWWQLSECIKRFRRLERLATALEEEGVDPMIPVRLRAAIDWKGWMR